MMHKKLVTLLAILLMLLGTLLPGAASRDKQKSSKKTHIVVRDGCGHHLEWTELQAALKQLARLKELGNFTVEINLEALNKELAELPRSLAAMEKQLEKLDKLDIHVDMRGLEKSLESLPRSLQVLAKKLKKLEEMNIDAIVDQALKSLEGLDSRIEAALESAFEAAQEDI